MVRKYDTRRYYLEMGLEEPDHPTVGKKAPLSLKKPYLTKQQSPLSINATKEARDWYAKN